MAREQINTIPEPKDYKVLEAGFMFSQDCEVGDDLRLYPEQTVNYMPPFGNRICLAEDFDKLHAAALSDADDGDVAGKQTKADVIKLIDEANEKLADENKLTYKKNASLDKLSETLEKCDLLLQLQDLNAILADDKKVTYDAKMTNEELEKLIGDQ